MIKLPEKKDNSQISPSSFRDPSGFVFFEDNLLYRQVNINYKKNYDLLMNSGLYKSLVDSRLMLSHKEVDVNYAKTKNAYKVIKPELISFVSYPYEWSFGQLKDATLLTLKVQKIALDFGMTLKDCSAYNIQFRKGKPILIDTLSFEEYKEDIPWVAPYRQFCRHFLAPLSLMAYKDIRLNKLLQIYIDGVPLDLASTLLPKHTYLKSNIFYHVHINAKVQRHLTDTKLGSKQQKMKKKDILTLVDKLESAIMKMEWKPKGTEWAQYYDDPNSTNYPQKAFEHKKKLVNEFLDKINPKNVVDMGANIGVFSRIASDKGIFTISADTDPAAVQKNYLKSVENNETNILPLLIDLTNPSPDMGWHNHERKSFLKRMPKDTVMALALIHHLAISNNLPFEKIAEFFSKICSSLIIEFIPKSDSNVERLLSRREDIFPDYTQQNFEEEFNEFFNILDSKKIEDSERTLYLMKKKT